MSDTDTPTHNICTGSKFNCSRKGSSENNYMYNNIFAVLTGILVVTGLTLICIMYKKIGFDPIVLT